MGALLEVNELHYYYGDIHVVKGVSLRVDEGEIITLIGANGAGKTTTLRTISGLTPSAGVRGEILYNGRPIQKVSGNKIMGLGLSQVLEGRHIFSRLTVYENMIVGAYQRKDKKNLKSDLEDIYKLFPRLKERLNQMGGTLSGGEQQMLAIARSLIGRPRLILLDEPSLGLAPIIIKEIFEAIQRIQREGTTVLFVEQNSKIALSVANRGYVMQTGEIIMHDTCENLRENEDIKRAYLGMK